VTDKTATQNLTRTQATDDPRKMALYLKTLATEADQRMTAHYRDLARSQGPPFAVLRLNEPAVVDTAVSDPWSGTIFFDTVEIDTAGLADLSAAANQISLTETGYWWVGGYALLDGLGASGADVGVFVRANGEAGSDYRRNLLQGNMGSGTSYPIQVTNLTTVTNVFLTVTNSGSTARTTTTVTFAELWACKVRDL
jgi:hypothetical protein